MPFDNSSGGGWPALATATAPGMAGVFDLGGTTAGTVMEIGIFSTTLKSPDNIKITVPNSQIYGTTISNYNGFDTRRIEEVPKAEHIDAAIRFLDGG